MRYPTDLLLLVALGSLAGCSTATPPAPAAPAAPPFEAVATVKQLMYGIVVPTSDMVWKAGSAAPASEQEWTQAETSAAALAESGNLLMIGSRAVDAADWTRYSKALIAAARQCAQAAHARDIQKLADTGNSLLEVCEGCHMQYMKQQQ